MANYRLSENAKEDLKRIYQRGLLKFGEKQADKYYHDFFTRFGQIAEQPRLYPRVDDIRKGYRRSICGVDSIYYRQVNSCVEIMSILGRQDTKQKGCKGL